MVKDYIKLDNEGTYALMVPNKLLFLYEATEEEVLKELEKISNVNCEKSQKNDCANIAFITTFDCNLNCLYCYAKGGDTKEYISLQKAYLALDYLKASTQHNKLNLYLVGGGEPLLNMSLVKDIVDYSEQLFQNVYIHVVSNGTFDDETLNWLVKKKANVRISYDGLGQLNNRRFRNGESSLDKVRNNIKELIRKGYEVIVQCVITKSTVTQMIECALDIYNLGVRFVKFEPALPTAVSRECQDLSPDPILFADNLYNTILYITSNNIDLKIDTAYFAKPAKGYYCGMSEGNFTVTPEGYIIPCVEVARKTDPYFDKLFIGEVKQNNVQINLRNKEFLKTFHYQNYAGGCSSCKNRLICLGAVLWQTSGKEVCQ